MAHFRIESATEVLELELRSHMNLGPFLKERNWKCTLYRDGQILKKGNWKEDSTAEEVRILDITDYHTEYQRPWTTQQTNFEYRQLDSTQVDYQEDLNKKAREDQMDNSRKVYLGDLLDEVEEYIVKIRSNAIISLVNGEALINFTHNIVNEHTDGTKFAHAAIRNILQALYNKSLLMYNDKSIQKYIAKNPMPDFTLFAEISGIPLEAYFPDRIVPIEIKELLISKGYSENEFEAFETTDSIGYLDNFIADMKLNFSHLEDDLAELLELTCIPEQPILLDGEGEDNE